MIRTLTRSFFYIITGISLLALLSPLISPKWFWPATVPGLFFIYLVIIQLIYLGYWTYKKKKLAFVSLAVLFLSLPYFNRTISLYPMGSDGGTNIMSIASYNIYGLKKFRKKLEKGGEKVRKQLHNDLKDLQRPDVMCVQEANGFVQQTLGEILGYPHAHKLASKDLVLYSNHAFLSKGEVELPSRSGKCSWADIRVEGQPVRVYCVHLESNRVSSDADQLLREGNIQERKSWQKVVDLFRRYSSSAKDRAAEVKIIREHTSESPYPVVLAGDINDTPVSYTYQQLSRGLQDVFVKNSRGISSTYNGIIPFLRVDYIFTDKSSQVLNYYVPRWSWSDHYPVFTEIALDSLSKAN